MAARGFGFENGHFYLHSDVASKRFLILQKSVIEINVNFVGMIEMVTKSETLRKIQTEHGLTGSFKDKPIAEWLAKHNPSELEYTRAVQNFTGTFYNAHTKKLL